MDAGDQGCVSHIKLGQRFQCPALHGERVYLAGVGSSPHLTVTVAHGQQVGVQLGM